MSLAASPSVVELQKRHVIIVRKLKSEWAMADKGIALEDVLQRFSHLRDSLNASFEAIPLQDGMDHPAEDIIGDAVRSMDDNSLFEWFSVVCLDIKYPTFSASILCCLGRQIHIGTDSWRTELVGKALTVDDIEIRDAALNAAEFWGGQRMRHMLSGKVEAEPIQWLQDYMRDIIEDLR